MAKKNRTSEENGQAVDEVIATGEVKKPVFCQVTTEGDTVTFAFGNGSVINTDPHTFTEEIQRKLMYHGLTQKLRDSYSSAKGDFTFGVSAVEKVLNALNDGRWVGAKSVGESAPKTGELALALSNLKGIDLETVQAAVDKADDAKRKVWRSNPQVQAEIARIRADKARARAIAAAEKGETALSLD